MKKGLRWKIVLVVAVVVLAVVVSLPLGEKIHLGLDLRGGIHLLMQVVTDDAVIIETNQEILRLQEQMKKRDLVFAAVTNPEIGVILVSGLNPDQEVKVRDVLEDSFREWDTAMGPGRATLTMKPQVAQYLRDQAVNQAVETIRNRVDQFGVAEPTIQRQGGITGDRIIVELPGVDNPDRVKNIIKTTALLEWSLVIAGPAQDEETLLSPYGGQVPEDGRVVKGDPKRRAEGYFLVKKVPTVTGKDLRIVRRGTDEWNNPAVSFSLNPDGARRFETATGENINKLMAIILDDKVQSAPVINSRIQGDGIIQGNFTVEEAEDLVLILKSGALPASMKYLEERTIGPSLGADSIRAGLMASVVALALVIIFMIFYYRLAGINAVVALILNTILVVACLAYFKANLTLPGIAGIILAIGMAVDANVLIFERIKEELALGKSIAASIVTGFKRAFSAIFDSNVTTIISAVFLFQFGTGPIKGYAVTLIIGLVANLFTAVFVSRLIFDLTVSAKARQMSI
ncbi:MAG: protein translocase subunit SecD [Candidatus Aminicenantes bacterium]|nr:protein translocase subunit SecD [Candidatus Aminicenantes bacterium]